jgi:hypothetical protein
MLAPVPPVVRAASPEGRATALRVVEAANPPTRHVALVLLRVVIHYIEWWRAEGHEQIDVQQLFHPANVDRYIASRFADDPGVGRNVRPHLRRVGRAMVPLLYTHKLAAARRPPMPVPYTESEIAGLLRMAANQSTQLKRDRLEATICFGAGARLSAREGATVRGSDVSSVRGLVVVSVRGRRARVVPVFEPYGSRLLRLAKSYRDEPILGPVGPHSGVYPFTEPGGIDWDASLPKIEVSRLRATWLVLALHRLGFDALVAAAGTRFLHHFPDAVEYLPTPDRARVIDVFKKTR